MRNIITILLFMISIITVNATNYYVATAANGGEDGAGITGAIDDPWLTVTYGLTRTTSGDTLIIGLGDFDEGINQMVKPVGVSIMGTMTALDTTHIISSYVAGDFDGSIYCSSTAGTTTNDNSSISYIRFTGNNLTATRAIYVRYRNNLEIHHCTIEDFLVSGITLSASRTSYPNLYVTGLKVHHCIINNSATLFGGVSGYGSLVLIGTDSIFVYSNTFDNTARATGYNGHSLNFYRNKNHQIYNNVFYRNDHEITAEGTKYWNFFLEEWNYRGNGQFYNNTLYGLAQFSLGGDDNQIVAGCSYGYKVYGNQWLNSANGNRVYNGENRTAYAITIEGGGHQKVEIFRNYIQRFPWGIEMSTPTSSDDPEVYWKQNWVMDDIKIYYNIVENVGYADHAFSYGIRLLNETMYDPYYNTFSNILIANNVVTGNNGGTYPGYYGIDISGNGTLTDLDIINNIVYGFDSYGIHIEEHSSDGFTLDSCNATYNLMNGNGYNTVYFESSIVDTNIDITTGNITDAPLFVGGSPFDYSLQPDSPAINAGIDVELTQDYAHNLVPFGLTDIGAYEYYDEPLTGTRVFATPDATKTKFMRTTDGRLIMIIQFGEASPWTTVSSGLCYYRKGERDGMYVIDFSNDGGTTWELDIVQLELDEDSIIISIDDGVAGYRHEVRACVYYIDHELTPTGFDGGVEDTDWETVYSTSVI